MYFLRHALGVKLQEADGSFQVPGQLLISDT